MNNKYISFTVIIFSIILSGCGASSKGSINIVDSPISANQLSDYTDLHITVNSTKDIQLSTLDKKRLAQRIKDSITTEQPHRFKTINSKSSNQKKLRAVVSIKEYDEGNRFARLMSAGLGQIHIDADVTLSDYLSKNKLAEYEITKTFAWGGVFGGNVGIRQVEVGFSKAVADSIVGDD